jgi:hypothetical protein
MKNLRRVIFVLITVFSLASNIAILASTSFFTMATGAFSVLTSIPSVASRIHPKNTMVNFKGKNTRVADAVNSTTNSIKKRAVKTASRSVSSMAVEAIPYAGIAAIIGVTAWELKDLCETVKDMEALNQALNPDGVLLDNQSSICSMAIPNKEELLQKAGNASEGLADKVTTFLYNLEKKNEINTENDPKAINNDLN